MGGGVEIPRGVTPNDFSRSYPRLYHMAHESAWESIRRHGLLSTTSILNVWQVEAPKRHVIESELRRHAAELDHPRYGTAVIRDQKPTRE
jgi:hypothetical protein